MKRATSWIIRSHNWYKLIFGALVHGKCLGYMLFNVVKPPAWYWFHDAQLWWFNPWCNDRWVPFHLPARMQQLDLSSKIHVWNNKIKTTQHLWLWLVCIYNMIYTLIEAPKRFHKIANLLLCFRNGICHKFQVLNFSLSLCSLTYKKIPSGLAETPIH